MRAGRELRAYQHGCRLRELGFKSIAAHGHADALSFALCAFGKEVFVDPGPTTILPIRMAHLFPKHRAHNTVVVDDQDQSVMLGPFMWGIVPTHDA